MRLLLVDDDERFRALLRATCEAVSVGVDVPHAHVGVAAGGT